MKKTIIYFIMAMMLTVITTAYTITPLYNYDLRGSVSFLNALYITSSGDINASGVVCDGAGNCLDTVTGSGNTTQQMIDAVNGTALNLSNSFGYSESGVGNTTTEIRTAANSTGLLINYSTLINTLTTNINVNTTNINSVLNNANSNTSELFTAISNVNTNTSNIFTSIGNININTSSLLTSIGYINMNTTNILATLGLVNTNTSTLFSAVTYINTNTSTLFTNIATLNTSIKQSNTTAQIITASNSTGLLINWSTKITDTTIAKWSLNNTAIINQTGELTINTSILPTDTYNTTAQIITASNSTGLLINWNWTSGDAWNIFNGKILLFNESKLEIEYYNATSAVAITGTIDGDLIWTHHQDGNYDGKTVNITESAGSPGLDVRINFTDGIVDFTNGVMRYYTSSLAGDEPIIQLWDYNDSEWEDYPAITESETFTTIERNVFDSYSHVKDGNVAMRIYKASNGNTNNKYYIDWLTIAKGFGVPSGNEVDPFAIHKDGTSEVTANIPLGNYNISANTFKGRWNGTDGNLIVTGDINSSNHVCDGSNNCLNTVNTVNTTQQMIDAVNGTNLTIPSLKSRDVYITGSLYDTNVSGISTPISNIVGGHWNVFSIVDDLTLGYEFAGRFDFSTLSFGLNLNDVQLAYFDSSGNIIATNDINASNNVCDGIGNCLNTVNTYNNTQQMITASNSTGLLINWNATGLIYNWNTSSGLIRNWSNYISGVDSGKWALNNTAIINQTGELTINTSILSKGNGNTTAQIISSANSTGLLINWTTKIIDTTIAKWSLNNTAIINQTGELTINTSILTTGNGNTTQQMINAVNNSAINLSNAFDYPGIYKNSTCNCLTEPDGTPGICMCTTI